MDMAATILPSYIKDSGDLKTEPFGSGLINTTWRVYDKESVYILQKINSAVFKDPASIAENVRMISEYLKRAAPGYLFVDPIRTLDDEDLAYREGEGYYRLTPFIKGSHSIDVVEDAGVAYEAARQFGQFTALLSGMDASRLHITIPDFHNLRLRFNQFRSSLQHGNQGRIGQAGELVDFLLAQEGIVLAYDQLRVNPEFRLRVMHHDTKISNVLLDANNKGLCVIDLDTVMPGYYISDVGDMLRTYLSPASEEETDFSQIKIREDIFDAILRGYLEEMNKVLTKTEKQSFVYAGKFMIYMQAIRFLTDHFNDDLYYGAAYPGHNLNRANNQATLLRQLQAAESRLLDILEPYI